MKMTFLLIILIAELVSTNCNAQVLSRGINLDLESATMAHKYIGWDIDDVIDGDEVRVIAYTNLGAGDKYFSLSSSAKIYYVDLSAKKKLGSWDLGGYGSYFLESGLVDKSIQLSSRLLKNPKKCNNFPAI